MPEEKEKASSLLPSAWHPQSGLGDASLVEVSGGWEEGGGKALHCHLLVGPH